MNSVFLAPSKSDRWSTPIDFYEELHREVGFDFDPCPLDGTEDGTAPLFVDWSDKRVFCNPPYGPGIVGFLNRWGEPDLAVYLLPVRADVRWFHDIVLKNADEIRFVKGRLKFGGAPDPGPFAVMVVISRKQRENVNLKILSIDTKAKEILAG